MESIFTPAAVLLPHGCDLTRWSVIACDQFTSQPEYWEEVERFVDNAPSTLRLILPECRLGTPQEQDSIDSIGRNARNYLQNGVLSPLAGQPEQFIYLERTLSNGAVRRGLIGKIDLEAYDYMAGSRSPVRATEGTILSRIPPRMRIRQASPVETPHILLLADDPQRHLIEPLSQQVCHRVPTYQAELMQHSGAVCGWALTGKEAAELQARLEAFAASRKELVYAVGDGNHSLATAKACYEQLKTVLPRSQWEHHPARWALVELVNLYDPSLQFEAIHRVVFGTRQQSMLERFSRATGARRLPAGVVPRAEEAARAIICCHESGEETWLLPESAGLAVDALQRFLDEALSACGGTLDYVHGAEVVRRLGKQPGNLAFLLPDMEKTALFPAVKQHGALPRKTFSMGSACDKRFYFECRRITR